MRALQFLLPALALLSPAAGPAVPFGADPAAAEAVPVPKPPVAGRRTPAAPASEPRATKPRRSGGLFGGLFGGGGGKGGKGAGGDPRKAALLAAYPGAFRFDGNTIVFATGERVVWDDGRKKSPKELLANADVEDMFAYDYPPAKLGPRRPGRNEDPGRIRNDTFFKALYGASAGAVQQDLRTISWVPRLGGGSVAVTTRFGVDKKLAAVSAELERLPKSFHKFVRPSAGTFNWRAIAGTRRMSVHSYGAAIDINTNHANYWRWEKQASDGTVTYRNEIPMEVVAAFERHCFIWGGRWYHYDTMHFEYRPELLPGCRK